MKQVEGVFQAVCAVLGTSEFEGKVELTTEQRKEVIEQVTKGLASGEIDLSESAREKYDTDDKLRKQYVPGLVSNHLRKDKRLNGGVDYEPKNPGSRAGSGDEVIRELKKLMKVVTGEEERAAIQAEIDKRLAVIQAERGKSIEINRDLIPEELRHLA